MSRYFLSYFIVFIFLVTPSYAQEAGGLGGYTPPPLFGAARQPPPDHKADDLGLPVISKELPPEEETKAEEASTLIKKRVVKKMEKTPKLPVEQKLEVKNVEQVIPKPVGKPKTIKKKTISKIKEPVQVIPVNPGPEPIDLLKKEDIPPPPQFKKTVKKVTSEGVVKGPKTMPSNKKKLVETEVTFESDKLEPTNILERVKSPDVTPKETPLKTKEEIARIKEVIPLPAFIVRPDGSKKLAMLYLEAQSDVKETQINTLEQLIVPVLEENRAARLIIEAYASSQDDGLNSARRLALSRALAIRDYLLAQKIETNRIDVRALGAQSNIQPLDRVELIIAP